MEEFLGPLLSNMVKSPICFSSLSKRGTFLRKMFARLEISAMLHQARPAVLARSAMQTRTRRARPLDLLLSRTAETAETLTIPPKSCQRERGAAYTVCQDEFMATYPADSKLEEVWKGKRHNIFDFWQTSSCIPNFAASVKEKGGTSNNSLTPFATDAIFNAMNKPLTRLDRAIALLEVAEDQILEARTELLMINALETANELKLLRVNLKNMLGSLRMRAIDNLEPNQ